MDFELAGPSPAGSASTGAAWAAPPRRLKVAVLVDLLWSPDAGGHVKFWERAAAGAAACADGIDLTVHFAGRRAAEHRLADHVRFQLHPPVLGTHRMPWISHVPDHTDLSPWHPRLARALAGADLIHTTDAFFCHARTAERVARRRGLPLVNSVHTDTPRYTGIYAHEIVQGWFGRGALARWIVERFRVAERAERAKIARLMAHQRRCAIVLVPREEDRLRASAVLPAERILPLPRGLEHRRFDPRLRDRSWLKERHGIAPETAVVLCVGRVDMGKNVMRVAEAVASLAARGRDVVLFCAGEGPDRARIEALLGAHVRCPGVVLGEEMARVFASADLLAHASLIEGFANVVLEGFASGLPAVATAGTVTGRYLRPGIDGMLVADRGVAWAEAIDALIDDPERRRAMGRAARERALAEVPSWERVVAERLAPIWRRAAGWSAIR